jgi:hypothetical protein
LKLGLRKWLVLQPVPQRTRELKGTMAASFAGCSSGIAPKAKRKAASQKSADKYMQTWPWKSHLRSVMSPRTPPKVRQKRGENSKMVAMPAAWRELVS